MRTFSVKNFERFQHYTDRTPPWIKLYNALLDDYAFACLQDASKLHLIMIWLVASRTNNRIPYDAEWLKGRINASEEIDLDALLKAGFIQLNEELQSPEQDASKTLAECLPRERDRGREREEKESPPKAPRKRVACLNADQSKIFEEWYGIYPLHKARLAAEKAFLGALARASPAELLAGAARYRDECAGKERRYIAHPATWLNAGRWKDENAGLNGTVYGLPERRRPTAPPSAHLLEGGAAEGETAA